MEAKKRIEFIDLAKGVCILLVIMIHTDVNVDFPGLQAMRMPLYFILSGLFFKDYGGFFNLLIKKTNKILIPFLFFYLASYIVFYLVGWLSPNLIKSEASGIFDLFTQRQLFNNPIWFLLALFWANLMYCLISLITKNEWLRGSIVLGIGGIGVLLGTYHIFLPCYVDSAMSALPFFYFGYLLKKTPLLYPNQYDKYNVLWILLLYGVALCIDRWFDNPHIYFSMNIITGNWILGIILSLSSVMAVLFLCKIIKRLPFISYFGRYSIIPLCTHHLIYRPLKYMLIEFNVSGGVILSVLTILICWACIPLCIRFIPWFTAQKDLLPIMMPAKKK